MKAIKQAIGVFELRADLSDGLCPADKVALIVLREKVERENGCEHCAGTENSDYKDWCIFGETNATIRFCPMCGRKLKKEDT